MSLETREIKLFGRDIPGFWRDVLSEPIFGDGDATKHFSVKKKGFSVKRGEAIQ